MLTQRFEKSNAFHPLDTSHNVGRDMLAGVCWAGVCDRVESGWSMFGPAGVCDRGCSTRVLLALTFHLADSPIVSPLVTRWEVRILNAQSGRTP